MTTAAAVQVRKSSGGSGSAGPRPRAQARKLVPRSVRARVLAGFQSAGIGVSERLAFQRTKQWYRFAGSAWSEQLD